MHRESNIDACRSGAALERSSGAGASSRAGVRAVPGPWFLTSLEEPDKQQNDDDYGESATTDIHLQPPFVVDPGGYPLKSKTERPCDRKSPPTNKEDALARKSIIVSDISGREIRDEKDAAKVAITYGDARRGRVELDVLASEVDDLASKGEKKARRGRKPKSAA